MDQADSVLSTPPTNTSSLRHSRRSIVAGLLAMLPAASTASAAKAATANPDAEIIALAKQITDLRVQDEAAEAEYDRCCEFYQSMAAKRSRKLIWRAGDEGLVGYCRESHYLVEDGKMFLYCNLDDVERLPGRTSFGQWVFTGTEAEREKLGLMSWSDNRVKPIDGHDHLFISIGAEWQEKRAQELLAAMDEYNAAKEAADVASGLVAAADVGEVIHQRMVELCDRLQDLQPSTLEGYQAIEAVTPVSNVTARTDFPAPPGAHPGGVFLV